MVFKTKNFDLSGFDEIWSRVEKANSSGKGASAPALIEAEIHDMQAYMSAAGKYPKYARLLRKLASEEARHASILRGEFSLPAGKPEAPAPGDISLSALYSAETERAAAYLSLAAADTRRGDIFRKLASDEARHAKILASMLQPPKASFPKALGRSSGRR